MLLGQYIPRLNSMCFRAANRLCKATGMKPLKDYKLLEKTILTDAQSVAKMFDYIIPAESSQCTYVKVGKKSDLSFSREIISFCDEHGKLLKRFFRQNGENIKANSYKYNDDLRTVNFLTFDISRLSPAFAKTQEIRNKYGVWVKQATEYQIVRDVFKLYKNGKTAKSVFFRRVDYAHDANPDKQKITFTRFPLTLGFGKKSDKVVVSGVVNLRPNEVELSDLSTTPNFVPDMKDEFLKYRFIDIRTDKGIRYLTKDFLREKNLDCLNIYISPSSFKVSQNSSGHFSTFNREICFSKNLAEKSTSSVVDIAAHEVEHAYQHSLIGRRGSGNSRYETDAMKNLGALTPEEIKPAAEYAIARDGYPTLSDTENLRENELYWNNKLEVDARKAGAKAVKRFEQSSNYEFFDEFYE